MVLTGTQLGRPVLSLSFDGSEVKCAGTLSTKPSFGPFTSNQHKIIMNRLV